MYGPGGVGSVYGRKGTRLSPTLAAFVNGVAVSIHSFNCFCDLSKYKLSCGNYPIVKHCFMFVTKWRAVFIIKWMHVFFYSEDISKRLLKETVCFVNQGTECPFSKLEHAADVCFVISYNKSPRVVLDSFHGLWWYMAPRHSSLRSGPSCCVSAQWHDACQQQTHWLGPPAGLQRWHRDPRATSEIL